MRLSVRSGRKTLCSFVHNSLFLSPPLLHQLNMNVNSQLINQILPQSPPAKHVIDVTAAQKVLQPSSTPFTSSSSHRNALVELIKSPFLISTRSSVIFFPSSPPPVSTIHQEGFHSYTTSFYISHKCSDVTMQSNHHNKTLPYFTYDKKTSVDKKIVHTDRLESLS